MKLINPLNEILDSPVKVNILRFLITTKAEWNGRQIAREAGVAPATSHKALQELYRQGVLILRNIGKTHVYGLNKESFVVSGLLRPLFAREREILSKISSIITARVNSSGLKRNIVSIAVFGSVSRKDVHPASDIDLAVIVRDERSKSKIEALFQAIDAKVSREFGNTVSVYLNTVAEFKAKRSKGLSVIKNILKDYKLIYGKDLKWHPGS